MGSEKRRQEMNYNAQKLGGARVYADPPSTGNIEPGDTVLVAMPAAMWSRLLQDQCVNGVGPERGGDGTGKPMSESPNDSAVYAETPAEAARRHLRLLIQEHARADVYSWYDKPVKGEEGYK